MSEYEAELKHYIGRLYRDYRDKEENMYENKREEARRKRVLSIKVGVVTVALMILLSFFPKMVTGVVGFLFYTLLVEVVLKDKWQGNIGE